MLPKAHRIRKTQEFDKIYSNHKTFKSDNFQIFVHYIFPDKQPDKSTYPKVGFVVNKKVGNAPERNKVKRRLREIFRSELPNLKPTFKAIVIAFPQIKELSFEELKKEIINLLSSSNLKNGN